MKPFEHTTLDDHPSSPLEWAVRGEGSRGRGLTHSESQSASFQQGPMNFINFKEGN